MSGGSGAAKRITAANRRERATQNNALIAAMAKAGVPAEVGW